MRSAVKNALNAVLRRFGSELVATAAIDWRSSRTFRFAEKDLRYFYHYHNCGWPPQRCTERTVELAIADYWLSHVDAKAVWEIGAVTPYYWPQRVGCVVDPADPHPGVAVRKSLFAVSLVGRPVLSISTLEHAGTGDYGLRDGDRGPSEALEKIFAECPAFLITLPAGYNAQIDRLSFEQGNVPGDVKVRFLVRVSDACWREERDGCRAKLPYGPLWANAVIVMERGTVY